MANVSGKLSLSSTFLSLKEIELDEVRSEVQGLMVDNEKIECAFKNSNMQIIFTNKRIFSASLKGVMGEKVSYCSYPYSKIQCYGIETAGFMNSESELIVTISGGSTLRFTFKSGVDVRKINYVISKYVL